MIIGNLILKYPVEERRIMDRNYRTFVKSINVLDVIDFGLTLDIAKKYGLTFYDATYVSILEFSSVIHELYTYDKHFKKVNNSKIIVLKESE